MLIPKRELDRIIKEEMQRPRPIDSYTRDELLSEGIMDWLKKIFGALFEVLSQGVDDGVSNFKAQYDNTQSKSRNKVKNLKKEDLPEDLDIDWDEYDKWREEYILKDFDELDPTKPEEAPMWIIHSLNIAGSTLTYSAKAFRKLQAWSEEEIKEWLTAVAAASQEDASGADKSKAEEIVNNNKENSSNLTSELGQIKGMAIAFGAQEKASREFSKQMEDKQFGTPPITKSLKIVIEFVQFLQKQTGVWRDYMKKSELPAAKAVSWLLEQEKSGHDKVVEAWLSAAQAFTNAYKKAEEAASVEQQAEQGGEGEGETKTESIVGQYVLKRRAVAQILREGKLVKY